MKISVIIPSYNQAHFIRLTLNSILNQKLDHELEVLVMDGGSTDETVDVLKSFGDKIQWVSKSDKGQTDAVNKGIAKASGEIIAWLNSDDLYLDGTLQQVGDFFSAHSDIRWLYGKCRIIDAEGNEIWKRVTQYKNLNLKNYSYSRLLTENYISQPATFFKRDLFEEVNGLDMDLHYAMDYDLWLRFGKISPAGVIHDYLSEFRRHGESKSETGYKAQFLEQYNVAKRYTDNKKLLTMHKFNIYKIIYAYNVMGWFTKANG